MDDEVLRGYIVASEGPRAVDEKRREYELSVQPGLRLFDRERIPHPDREEVEQKARQLARQNQKARFYVLEIVSVSYVRPVPVETVVITEKKD